MKKITTLSVLAAMCLALTACANGGAAQTAASEKSSGTTASSGTEKIYTITDKEGSDDAVYTSTLAKETSEMFTARDYEVGWSDCTEIALSDSGSTVQGGGAKADGSIITITEAGSYHVTGALTNGSIVIDADGAKVQLVLDNASVSCTGGAALYVKSADKVFVTTAAGSKNSLSSSGEFTQTDDNKVDGAVFAKSDITFNGSGSLDISCESAHGIVCKDDLKFTGGTYTVTAKKKGIDCKESVRTAAGDISITCGTDGIHAENDTAEKAFVYIGGGNITISCGDDGIHASSEVLIADGVTAITQSKEGIEGETVTISGGKVSVRSTDDGINAAGGSDNTSSGGRGGFMDTDENAVITISGGYVTINADGDGIDSNGYLYVSGGTTFVSGPTNAGNGALDYGISGTITGGSIIAAGATGMAENFGESSTQGSILYTFDGTLAAGTEITLKDSGGNTLISYAPEKEYQCAVISTPEVASGSTYTLTAGDKSYTVEMTSNIYGSGSGFGGFGKNGGFGGFDKNGGFGGFDKNGGFGGFGDGSAPQFDGQQTPDRGGFGGGGGRGDRGRQDNNSVSLPGQET